MSLLSCWLVHAIWTLNWSESIFLILGNSNLTQNTLLMTVKYEGWNPVMYPQSICFHAMKYISGLENREDWSRNVKKGSKACIYVSFPLKNGKWHSYVIDYLWNAIWEPFRWFVVTFAFRAYLIDRLPLFLQWYHLVGTFLEYLSGRSNLVHIPRFNKNMLWDCMFIILKCMNYDSLVAAL